MNTDICFFVKKLDHHISRRFYSMYSRKALEECSVSNVWIVDYLYDHRDRDVFQKEIEDKFFVNRATVSKMLKLMEEKKLICRMPSAADSRKKKLILDEKGYALRRLCQSIRSEMEMQVASSLTEEEKELFRSLCLKMIKNMEGEMESDDTSADEIHPGI